MKSVFLRRFLASATIAAWGAASLSGVEIVPDARKIEPLARATDEPGVEAVQKRILGAPARYAASFPVFIHLAGDDPDIPRKVLALGGRASAVHSRLYAGAIPRDAGRYVSNWPSVAYIEAAKRARPLLDASRAAVDADIVQSGGSGLPASFTGAGSLVGIVDTGLSRFHLDFYGGGQPTSPRVAQWFPNLTEAGVDTAWHGTHVAGIAAGNGFLSGGPGLSTSYTGMAPGAGLLVVKSTFLTTDIPAEIDRILAAAGASPVAVNLSLGTVYGPHDGTSGFEQSIDARAAGTSGSSRIITVAAGNERVHNEHFQWLLPPFGFVTVPVAVSRGSATIDIWADGADRYDVTASVPGGTASVGADQPPNGATHFQVFLTAGTAVTGSISMRRTRNGGSGRVDAYVDAGDGSFQSTVSAETGTITEPANGYGVMTVGSFNTKAGGGAGAVGDISGFSSLGPTRDGRLKPDISAPGSVIYSGRSLDPYAGFPVPATVPGNDNYAIMQGTSMAAPHVAGIAALVWESNPTLTGAQMRARLKKAANLPPAVSLPDDTWGYGKVNALRAITEAVAGITAPATVLPGQAGGIRADEKSSGPFGQAINYSWSVSAGASVDPATGHATTFVANAPGNYTVSLTATSGTSAPGTDDAVIHVNNIPTAVITGPASTDNVIPVAFSGASSSDPDGQPLTLRWILVSRPANSGATFPTNSVPGVTLTPDQPGTYEIGLRVDDGLDNSALAVVAFQSGFTPAFQSGGGGGGCSVARPGETDPGTGAGTIIYLLTALAGSLGLRRRVRRERK